MKKQRKTERRMHFTYLSDFFLVFVHWNGAFWEVDSEKKAEELKRRRRHRSPGNDVDAAVCPCWPVIFKCPPPPPPLPELSIKLWASTAGENIVYSTSSSFCGPSIYLRLPFLHHHFHHLHHLLLLLFLFFSPLQQQQHIFPKLMQDTI